MPRPPGPSRLPAVACIIWLACCAPSAAQEPYGRFQFDEADRDHWSFVPVKRPEVPAVRDAAWVKSPIDAFVLARLDEEGLALILRPTERPFCGASIST